MKIAVTDTGKPKKQKIYMDWLQRHYPAADLVQVSYRDGLFDFNGYNGLVLTGGEDVDPALSQASPLTLVEQVDRARDDFEFRLLEQAMNRQRPVLGICRGLQVANVFFGGTLIADLPAAGFHRHTSPDGSTVLLHTVNIVEGSDLHRITGISTGEVNSYHHQSVERVADELSVSALSPDGVIEGLEWKSRHRRPFLMLVQWHPERMTDGNNPCTKKIAESFFQAVEEYQLKD